MLSHYAAWQLVMDDRARQWHIRSSAQGAPHAWSRPSRLRRNPRYRSDHLCIGRFPYGLCRRVGSVGAYGCIGGMRLRPDPQANMQPSALAHWPIPHWDGVFRYPCRCGAPIKPSGLIPIRNYSGCAPMMHIPADYKTHVHRPPCQRKSRSAHMTLAHPTRWSPTNGTAPKLIQRDREPRGQAKPFHISPSTGAYTNRPRPQTPQAPGSKCKTSQNVDYI